MTKKRFIIVALAALLALGLFTSCANDTAYPGDRNIIEAGDVIGRQGEGIVVDARSAQEYAKGHMEGAVNLPPALLTTEDPVPGTLAPKAQVEQELGKAGISKDSTVYVYDDDGGVSAGRVWWAMKVYGHDKVFIVNGGAQALVRAKAKLTAQATIPAKVVYEAQDPNLHRIANFDEVRTLAENPQPGKILVDVRSAAEYAQGHIPTAKLYPHTNNLYKDGTFLSKRDLRLFYQDEGIQTTDEIIVYCKSSFRAAQTAALLEEAGFQKVKIYDGAWNEWEQKMGQGPGTTDQAPVGSSDGS